MAASFLTLPLSHFILFVCSNCAVPACLYLPEFPVRSLAYQTRISPAGALRLKLNDLKMPRSEAARW